MIYFHRLPHCSSLLKRLVKKWLLAVFAICFSQLSYATETILVSSPFLDERNIYINELLVEVLKQTEEKYGHVKINYAIEVNNERAKKLALNQNYGDILRGVAKLDWEEKLIPIRIPILKGLNGLRVFFINKNDQEKFSKINTIDEIKQCLGGLGHTWIITKALKQQNFKIVTTPLYSSLFSMLEKKRFDYFSRGVHQVLYEYKKHKPNNPELHIEETILFNLPLPVFFYVNPNKPKLAVRIKEGLEKMRANGSFEKLFAKHFAHTYRELNLAHRKLFNVENPNLSEASKKVVKPISLADFE